MLIDKVKLNISAGNGGDGCVSFLREKHRPNGGPNGGNGGNGGNVYLCGVDNIHRLKKFTMSPTIKAENGKKGGKNKWTGKNGENLYIKLPFGTRVYNLDNGEIFDILPNTPPRFILHGGGGGKGNWEFRSATNQVPVEFEKGKKGQSANFVFELQLIADIGLIGLPNVGKSSLLNALTKAHAAVADYSFTTLEPNLGTLETKIMADIPGLIEGASTGRGLGTYFLKHINRTKLLVHCINCQSTDPKKDYEIVRKEIGDYSKRLLEIPELVVFTKTDLLSEKEKRVFLIKAKKITKTPLLISITDDKSLETLKKKLVG